MADFSGPVATELTPTSGEQKLVRPAQKLVIHDLGGVDVAKVGALFPACLRVKCAAEQVVLAEEERVNGGRAAPNSRTDDQGYFVHRRDREHDATVPVGVREHARVGDEGLRAQNALGLRASDFGADIAQLQRQISPDHGVAGRYVLLCRETARALPDIVAGDVKWRIGVDVYP